MHADPMPPIDTVTIDNVTKASNVNTAKPGMDRLNTGIDTVQNLSAIPVLYALLQTLLNV